jgi:hypothetical protein
MDTSHSNLESHMTTVEAIIPTLATKADLANVRAEILAHVDERFGKMQTWIIGILLTVIFGFTGMIGVMFSLYSRAPAPATPAAVAVQQQPDPIVIVIPAISLAQPAKP